MQTFTVNHYDTKKFANRVTGSHQTRENQNSILYAQMYKQLKVRYSLQCWSHIRKNDGITCILTSFEPTMQRLNQKVINLIMAQPIHYTAAELYDPGILTQNYSIFTLSSIKSARAEMHEPQWSIVARNNAMHYIESTQRICVGKFVMFFYEQAEEQISARKPFR